MKTVKEKFENLLFYLPFLFSAGIVYFSSDANAESGQPLIMYFLPICFYWLGDYLRQNNNESKTLRHEIEELKKTIEELSANR